ncbi:MAG: hypothetical protein R3B48_21775 [Kofleriaceae bacterium]
MDRSSLALARTRRAYELAHVASGARGLVLTATLLAVAAALHELTPATWLLAGLLGATLAVFGWRGGALRRGGVLGVAAGTLPLVVPALLSGAGPSLECLACAAEPTTGGVLICLGVGALAGVLVGGGARRDAVPQRCVVAAAAVAALTGSLGCGLTVLGGAIVAALSVGAATAWLATAAAR